jgi:PAS domain S-box-containing protein
LRHFHNRLMPERNQTGAVDSVLSIWEDITERVETLGRLRTLVENLPDMVALYDPKGLCLYVNSVMQKMFDAPAEVFLGKTILDLPPPTGREAYQKLFASTLQAASEGASIVVEVTWPLPTGVRDCEVRYVPEKDKDGVVTSVLSIARDITEQKRAQNLAAKLNRELKLRLAEMMQSARDVEALSYSMGHDLNTPLRAIDGFTRIILDEYGDSIDNEAKRCLFIVRDNVVRMEKLIDGLLDYISLSRSPMRMEPVDMSALAREVFETLRTAEPERNMQLVLGEAPVARCDRTLIRRVLANLIGNAIKFTRSQTKALIEIGGANEGTESVYYVKDNGVGFDMRFEAKLFGVFERLHGAEEFEGTGIGLAAVKRILERHGGRVWAESASSHGATIHFSLPIAETET